MTALTDKMVALAASKEERTRNMSPKALRAADAAFNNMAETLVPMFVDDDGNVDVEVMGGIKVASTFFAEMLQEMSKHPTEDIADLLQNGI